MRENTDFAFQASQAQGGGPAAEGWAEPDLHAVMAGQDGAISD